MVQICPECKKTIPEDIMNCPHCDKQLVTEESCPFCKEPISSKDTQCPHCGNILISEYPKQVTAKRNAVLFPLGISMLIILLGYNFLTWRGMISQDSFLNPIVIGVILVGIVFYGAYIGKGDKDFWFGK